MDNYKLIAEIWRRVWGFCDERGQTAFGAYLAGFAPQNAVTACAVILINSDAMPTALTHDLGCGRELPGVRRLVTYEVRSGLGVANIKFDECPWVALIHAYVDAVSCAVRAEARRPLWQFATRDIQRIHARVCRPGSTSWFAVGNTAEHSGFVTARHTNEIWSQSNESGWTYQDIEGPHGRILGEFASETEAQACLDKWLECNDDRCYSHGSRCYVRISFNKTEIGAASTPIAAASVFEAAATRQWAHGEKENG